MMSGSEDSHVGGAVLGIALVTYVVLAVTLMWARSHLYPLRSGGRSKVLYTIGAAGALLR